MAEDDRGWMSWTAESLEDLPPDQRERARHSMARRDQERGPLLAQVSVRVFKNGAEPYVAFPAGCALGVESDRAEIAAAVERARDALAEWR